MYPAFRAASQKMRGGVEAGLSNLRDARVRGFESLRAGCVGSGEGFSLSVLKISPPFGILILKPENDG